MQGPRQPPRVLPSASQPSCYWQAQFKDSRLTFEQNVVAFPHKLEQKQCSFSWKCLLCCCTTTVFALSTACPAKRVQMPSRCCSAAVGLVLSEAPAVGALHPACHLRRDSVAGTTRVSCLPVRLPVGTAGEMFARAARTFPSRVRLPSESCSSEGKSRR